MRSLLRFLIRYHPAILFIVLEIVAFLLVAQFNSFHRAKLINVRHSILGGITRKFENVSNYLSLATENKSLVLENTRLYNLLPSSYFSPLNKYKKDSFSDSKFSFIGARVINNSTNKQYNFITLNKGKIDGIEPEMAVICDEGIVGVVKATTDHYASVISVLNREFFPSAKIKRSGYFGPIEWPGKRYDRVILKEIPLHVEIFIGDTIVTSGFSSIFPEGINVGTVKEFKTSQGIFNEVTVQLSADFKKLSNVLVIKNYMREEKLKLETEVSHD